MLDARDAWWSGEPLDPWGRPWYVAMGSSSGGLGRGWAGLETEWLASTGPDQQQGSPAFPSPGDDDFLVGMQQANGRRESISAAGAARYERLPLALLGLAVVLPLTRMLSARTPRRADGPRFTVAGMIALVPTVYAWLAIAALEALPLLQSASGVVTIPPTLAVAGSTFALFFTLVFAHRELNTSGPLAARDRTP
jgi:hypothetical protein